MTKTETTAKKTKTSKAKTTQPDKTPTWLTVQQAANVLGVHPATVRKWAATGDLIKRLVPGERAMQLKGNITANGEHEVLVSHLLSWKLMTSRSF